MGLLPFGEDREKLHRLPLVADEIVVDQEQGALPSQPVQRIELGHHLGRRLRSGYAAVKLGDVTEFAVEWAPPRKLKTHRIVVVQVDEIEARNRCHRDIRLPRLPIDRLRGPVFQILQEAGEDLLRFVQHEVPDPRDLVVERGGVGSPGNDRHAGAVAALDHGLEGNPLDDHGGREDQIGPVQIGVLQRSHVHVDDPQVVFRRKHRGDGEQAQRRKGRLDAHHLQSVVGAPIGRRVFGIDQKRPGHGSTLRPLGQARCIAATAAPAVSPSGKWLSGGFAKIDGARPARRRAAGDASAIATTFVSSASSATSSVP